MKKPTPHGFKPSKPLKLSQALSLALPPALPHTQRGASVTGVILTLMALGILIKLSVAILPAQYADYSASKVAAQALATANANKQTPSQLIQSIDKQFSINAFYDLQAVEMYKITNNKLGSLELYKDYAVSNHFFGNIDIVNRFEGEIMPADATQ